MKTRLAKLRRLMAQREITYLMVTKPENRLYLSGFTGTAGILLIGPDTADFFTDFRYIEQVKQQSPHFRAVKVDQGSPFEAVAEVLRQYKSDKLFFEDEHLTVKQYHRLKEHLGQINPVPAGDLAEELRMVKDQQEIGIIRRAMEIGDRAFAHILNYIKPGVAERELACELEFFMRRQGASGAAFATIVASGPRSALPHGVAGDRRLQPGDFITMDFGAVYQGYHSDMTRTVVLGEPDEKQQEIYNIVLAAQLAGLAAVRPGVKAREVDEAARQVIERRGYGEYFGHGTGHGVGLAIHENPRLAAKDETVLQAGMVVTVEPGIYLPGWGGVRIEDSVLVTDEGCEVLTSSPKHELLKL
ncbi:M24 family metallopeptidase [Desulforamulus hydrothermalis]|uniref:Xaa-Pro and Met-Xaa peptidase n=1 Tax=Desulforamulus hydrothermalis Lam5 = DSM 18033 TaxID=1121428 RepID=K8E072_9FIRM|nr:Xaa-Pro peptidase family protein [Desulforamulus hydrothermalis]CCO08899.1 Xaa-Pro and Met-Xaa peptidase [Desulforamulus hydrothermalis Lam5 = DSM 18033]SHG74274.1 Xaa-Pro dipeptidase [Desulforamulus hydrothermalis Lam5 = DSM 18033]